MMFIDLLISHVNRVKIPGNRETECDTKYKQGTINAQYAVSIDHPKMKPSRKSV
jgi:hypothetical protein